jgi:uncharacterized protein
VNSIWIAFITGLTTGGLSCMAVQGGLVTGALARQVETGLARKKRNPTQGRQPQLALPIVLFLAAKLAVYSLLGFVLGGLGSVLSLSPVTRGVLQIAIAVFMLGNALRMLNVHPIFRYFSFEPPAAIRRLIRQKSKEKDDFLTPLTLGALTILIPCGITQAMMAVAVSTGAPLAGAATMFAFILGTSPVFFALTYLATRLSALFEKYFFRIVAVALLALAFITLNTGLNLVGSPFTFNQVAQALGIGQNGDQTAAPALPSGPLSNEISLNVTNRGYSPSRLFAPAGQTITLHLVTHNTTSCSRDFTIPAFNMDVLLDQNGDRVVELPPQKSGSTLHYACSMGMFTGDIVFE